MRSSEQLAEQIAMDVGHVYFRPLLYGGTAIGVHSILHVYHELWAYLTERDRLYHELCLSPPSDEILAEIGFDLREKIRDLSLTEAERAGWTVQHWRVIKQEVEYSCSVCRVASPIRRK